MHSKIIEHKILLVDDDPKNLQVAMSILKEFNIIYAQSASKALELIENNDFDLILLDIVMPEMNGFEVCEKIKADEKTKDIPIIFLTVKNDEKDIVKGFELGAVDYITKPFYSAVLLKRVETHLFLSKSLKDLTTIVHKQVSQIRQKDKILFQQSKITALSEIVNAVSNHWKSPLGLIKMHLQSLELKAIEESVSREYIQNVVVSIYSLVDLLDRKISDFSDCFKYGLQTKNINIKVILDSILFKVKDNLVKENIEISIKGEVSLKIDIVEDELKHIIMKLIHKSISAFTINEVQNKKIEINLSSGNNTINLSYIDNSGNIKEEELLKIFDYNFSMEDNDKEKGLGLYLTKIFVEKNSGEIFVNNYEEGVCFNISFPKDI